MRERTRAPRRRIVTADDLGLRRAYEAAIREAWASGIVRSVSVVTNGDAYESALDFLREEPSLETGVHLNVIEGTPLSEARELAPLLDREHRFAGLFPLLRARAAGKLPTSAIAREWDVQVARAIRDGLRPLHLNSHHHVHMLPELFRVAAAIAERHAIPVVRVTDEPPWRRLGARSIAARCKTAALWALAVRARAELRMRSMDHAIACRGIASSGRLGERAWIELASDDTEVAEIVCHPGQSREQDEALASPRVAALFARELQPTSFADVVGGP